ncbi:TPA: hypothetical protein ACIPBB_004625, partial [Salmonella enterica subsp. diarizonae serovar 61:l,v:z35]
MICFPGNRGGSRALTGEVWFQPCLRAYGRECKASGLGNWIRIADARGLLMIASQITLQPMW